MFLVEGGGGFGGEGFAGFYDFTGVSGEAFAVRFESVVGSVLFPMSAEFAEDVE